MSFPCWCLSFEEIFKLWLIVAHQVLLQLVHTVTVLRLDGRQMWLHKKGPQLFYLKKTTVGKKGLCFSPDKDAVHPESTSAGGEHIWADTSAPRSNSQLSVEENKDNHTIKPAIMNKLKQVDNCRFTHLKQKCLALSLILQNNLLRRF